MTRNDSYLNMKSYVARKTGDQIDYLVSIRDDQNEALNREVEKRISRLPQNPGRKKYDLEDLNRSIDSLYAGIGFDLYEDLLKIESEVLQELKNTEKNQPNKEKKIDEILSDYEVKLTDSVCKWIKIIESFKEIFIKEMDEILTKSSSKEIATKMMRKSNNIFENRQLSSKNMGREMY